MRVLLVIIVSLVFVSNCYAAKVIYYDSAKNYMVINPVGSTIAEINELHGISITDSVTVDETKETARVENGALVKYNYIQRNRQLKEDRKAARDQSLRPKKNALKAKLNLTEQDIDDLKEVLE